jgi:hypothetical protein
MHRLKSSVQLANVDKSKRQVLVAALTLLTSSSLVFLAGCGISGSPLGTSTTSLAIQGSVHGGAQPVKGSTITLYAANQTAYAGASTVLTTTTTDNSGNFNITGTYTCPANSQVYIAATGGDPGTGVTNPQLALAAGLGTCSGSLSSSLFIHLNEVTTVATAYALSGFATDLSHVGTSSTNVLGLTNAMKTINNLVDNSSGLALTITPAYAGSSVAGLNTSIVPQAQINTIADVLSGCVNSTGGVSGDASACGKLFAAVPGTTSTDTFKAALNIAQNPGQNVAAIYNTLPPVVGLPFQPTLTATPSDWTIAVTYIGGGLGQSISTNRAVAADLQLDANGNVWVSAAHNSAIVELDNFGAPISPSTTSTVHGGYGGASSLAGISAPGLMAIDLEGDVWAINSVTGAGVAVLTNTGAAYSTSPFTDASLPSQTGITIDGSDNVWLPVNQNTSVVEFSHAGAVLSGTTGFLSGLSGGLPGAIAANSAGHIIIEESAQATDLLSNGSLSAVGNPGAYLGAGGSNRMAIDGLGNMWMALNQSGQYLLKTNSVLTSSTNATTFTAPSYLNPGGIAVDGGENVWVATQGSSSGTIVKSNLTEFTNSGLLLSPSSTGFLLNESGATNVVYPTGLGIDRSGNVWVANSYGPTGVNGQSTVQEFVGAAVPTVTPLALAVKNNTVGVKP